MKKTCISILVCIVLLFGLSSLCDAGTRTITFTWTQPATNADGTPLTDLVGWRLYKSTTPNVTVASGNLMATIPYSGTPSTVYTAAEPLISPDGQAAKYYFVLTAFDTSGNESAKGNEVSTSIDFLAPATPSALTVSVTVGP